GLARELKGEAKLSPLEPNLRVALRFLDSLGHMEVNVDITGDHLHERHRFIAEIDQPYLPRIIAELRAVLQPFPVRGAMDSARHPTRSSQVRGNATGAFSSGSRAR